jgi:hypothetical protein
MHAHTAPPPGRQLTDAAATVESLGVRNGDSLTARAAAGTGAVTAPTAAATPPAAAAAADAPAAPVAPAAARMTATAAAALAAPAAVAAPAPALGSDSFAAYNGLDHMVGLMSLSDCE